MIVLDYANHAARVCLSALVAGAAAMTVMFLSPAGHGINHLPVASVMHMWIRAATAVLCVRLVVVAAQRVSRRAPRCYRLLTPSRATGVVGWGVWPAAQLAAAVLSLAFMLAFFNTPGVLHGAAGVGEFAPRTIRAALLWALPFCCVVFPALFAWSTIRSLRDGLAGWILGIVPNPDEEPSRVGVPDLAGLLFRAQLVDKRDPIGRPIRWHEVWDRTGMGLLEACRDQYTDDIYAAGRYEWQAQLRVRKFALARLRVADPWECATSERLRPPSRRLSLAVLSAIVAIPLHLLGFVILATLVAGILALAVLMIELLD